MRSLINELISGRMSRRSFLAGMASASFGATAAKSALAAVEPLVPGSSLPEGFARSVTGPGADLHVKQMIEAGAGYLFVFNG